jgi:hypothetical protein
MDARIGPAPGNCSSARTVSPWTADASRSSATSRACSARASRSCVWATCRGIRPKTRDGVYAREVDGRVLYVNTTSEPRDVAIDRTMQGVLPGKRWSDTLRLESLGVDLLEK